MGSGGQGVRNSCQQDRSLRSKTIVPKWALDVIEYLYARELSNEKWEPRKVKNKSTRYTLIDGVLYKQGFFAPSLEVRLIGKSVVYIGENT